MAIPKILPSRELVCRLLDYNPVTGAFLWKPRPREGFPTQRGCSIFNAQFVGKPAGSRLANGYLLIRTRDVDGYYAQRLAWLIVYGEPVPSEIDHRDGNPGNNRIANLRAASRSQNLANARLKSDSSTGIKGVTRRGKRYMAKIQFQGTQIYLGMFDTAAEATQTYREAAIRLFGEFARW